MFQEFAFVQFPPWAGKRSSHNDREHPSELEKCCSKSLHKLSCLLGCANVAIPATGNAPPSFSRGQNVAPEPRSPTNLPFTPPLPRRILARSQLSMRLAACALPPWRSSYEVCMYNSIYLKFGETPPGLFHWKFPHKILLRDSVTPRCAYSARGMLLRPISGSKSGSLP